MKVSLPTELLDNLEGIHEFNRQSFQDAHMQQEPVTSIRFNSEKIKQFAITGESIYSEFNLSEAVPWCEYGYYLNERPVFTFDPLLHGGVYYVQEASSMFLYEVLKQTCVDNTEKKVLDLCAAPGGKSSLLASYFVNGLLVSNEIIKQRASILYENLTKWGTANVVITNNDAAAFKRLANYFDVIVMDAPCSGSGLFRKDENAISEWSLKNVELCSQRQQRILADVYPALKQNGILIYSTCSYSEEENEDITDWIKDNFNVESLPLKMKDHWNIVETQSNKHKAFGYRFWADKIKGEGFFIAAFKKNDGELSYKTQKSSLAKISKRDKATASKYLKNEHNSILFMQNDNIHAISNEWINDVSLLEKNLYLRKAGVKIGTIKRDELIPHHELALSTITNGSIQKFELACDEALQYLRKKEIKYKPGYKGWMLSTYKNYPLGWLKFLHNRVNNYYPTEWRILKD